MRWMWIDNLKLNPDQMEVLLVALTPIPGDGTSLRFDGVTRSVFYHPRLIRQLHRGSGNSYSRPPSYIQTRLL